MKRLLLLLPFLLLSACALTSMDAPITNAPVTPLQVAVKPDSDEAADIRAAAANANQAVAIGVLRADDPAVNCSNSIVKAAGLDATAQPAGQSFVPTREGPLSDAMIVYIRAQQLKGSEPLRVPPGCGDLLIQLRVDAVRAVVRLKGLR